jgi:hypothetical protein
MAVCIFFWFDVEDYVTPESDVALGRLIDIFDRHGLKATFKMVAEKVRGLERRGYGDVIRKLRAHDIGYHTDYHSRPPSISEYLLECDWQGGITEFMHREQAGLDTLKRAFLRSPSCYGQPGGAWAPQVYPALRQWGIPVYLDAGPWVELEGRPHRYCDVINLLGLQALMSMGISGGHAEVSRRKTQLAGWVDRLRPTGGEISLYAHECEFVTRTFWDAVNFRRGTDTPRESWQAAPLLPVEESEERYAALEEFLTFAQSLPDVRIVVASQAPLLYLDRAKGRSFTPQEIAQLCTAMADRIAHQRCDGVWLAPAEIYGLAVALLAARVRNGKWPDQVSYRYLDGPPMAPLVDWMPGKPSPALASVTLDDLFGTCLFEDAYLSAEGHMPAQVQIGSSWLAPADFLATICASLPLWLDGGTDDAAVLRGEFVQARHVPDHVSWDWLIFPPGFNGDSLLQMGKLQAWTLKPVPMPR